MTQIDTEQYRREKQREYARKAYHKAKADPEKLAQRKLKRDEWWSEKKDEQMLRQKEKKRQRKLDAINYLGGSCKECGGNFHPSIYEFHHRDPETKDNEPSKMLLLSWARLKQELDKCDLLCANCHRLVHHKWECN